MNNSIFIPKKENHYETDYFTCVYLCFDDYGLPD